MRIKKPDTEDIHSAEAHLGDYCDFCSACNAMILLKQRDHALLQISRTRPERATSYKQPERVYYSLWDEIRHIDKSAGGAACGHLHFYAFERIRNDFKRYSELILRVVAGILACIWLYTTLRLFSSVVTGLLIT
eukprot:5298685-Pleurochrysis_carterae.AAC.1